MKHPALEVIGGLSDTSKMPCYSYSLPAEECRTGSRLMQHEGSVCSICYALKGQYMFQNVQVAMYRRYGRVMRALKDPEFRERWVQAFAEVLEYLRTRPRGKQYRFFRWHDSGDIQSVDHLAMIAEVCRRTPKVRHWLPTKEYRMVAEYAAEHDPPGNLIIRLSAAMIDGKVPELGFPVNVTVSDREEAPGYVCPATTQRNECGRCRACWSPNANVVSLVAH